jgi:hypothetical protein
MVKNSFSENGGVLHYTYEYARTIMDIQSMQFFHQTFFTDNYERDRDRKAGIGQHENLCLSTLFNAHYIGRQKSFIK